MSTRSTRKSTAPESNSHSDMGVTDLLSALVAFMQPVIQKYVASPGPALSKDSDKNDRIEAELINGLEGTALLSALTEFVTATVNSTLGEDKKREEPAPAEGVDNKISKVPPGIPKTVPRSELETMTLSAVRAHVFNKMPIRLLAFDKSGSDIQLIGRNKITARILPGVLAKTAEPKFQSAWAAAEALNDVDVVITSMRYRHNKMNELLRKVIEKSVNYAILSHTWMRDIPGDITFQDWATREHNPRGNTKIVKFCEVAAWNHNVTLGWIDTVCINKDSSSELDESIRSMYSWYRGASACITYLSETTNISDAHHDSWFTRGWTLQELLAPSLSIFYNGNWKRMGSSNDVEIQTAIQKATGITSKELDLSWTGAIEKIPFSRRMQLACGRQVTREEDTSYSLMGILDVDISIAYGEGSSRAFLRLVRELLKTKKNVIDLFNRTYDYGDRLLPSSLESYNYRSAWHDDPNGGTRLDNLQPLDPIILTNLGVRIPILLTPGLATDAVDDRKYVPKGDLYGKTSFTYISRAGTKRVINILLLDSKLYAGDITNLRATRPVALPDGALAICMLAIVNFGVDTSGHILLPEQCFALDISWDGLQSGIFSPPGSVEIRAGAPANFLLKSKKGFKIHKDEVEKHGMQLVSLYL
ncbi:hypothetical protein HYPSUDRAFT_40166 [Hypholoma sublateritium FD-334 SS-4]|uniref:Heterokaryon incompatibility domain-containing protein n=1 Tax=Hypholoma sublateritium (strain FD-334 SS-4) TaxID=945553 RepID=A0A0D2NW50_HYPSF|nr:hypothetical protein HYPSUDRAFT_40166 [Hypholoma sublateritium FD-334 SS-4]